MTAHFIYGAMFVISLILAFLAGIWISADDPDIDERRREHVRYQVRRIDALEKQLKKEREERKNGTE